MGNQSSQQLQLRASSIMTKLLLKSQEDVIQHLTQQEIQLNRPINQMGDRIAHYASYKSMYRLLQWLIYKDANFLTVFNHRRLSPVDVAVPQTRQWIYKKVNQYQKEKLNKLSRMQQQIKANQNTPSHNQMSSQINSLPLTQKQVAQQKKQTINTQTYQPIKNQSSNNAFVEVQNKDQSQKKNSLDFANILFGAKP